VRQAVLELNFKQSKNYLAHLQVTPQDFSSNSHMTPFHSLLSENSYTYRYTHSYIYMYIYIDIHIYIDALHLWVSHHNKSIEVHVTKMRLLGIFFLKSEHACTLMRTE